jgi:geranylgeranylglycerol-phosphate geranylgeranyltransferase
MTEMLKLKALWELYRLEHGLMYALGVVIGIVVAEGITVPFEKAIFGILTAVFLQASAFALNDYFDYEVDLMNERYDRPLVRGELSKSSALMSFAILTPIGFMFSYLISFTAFVLAFAITILGFFYDVKLKEFGILGNAYIGFTMCAPFIFGSVVAKNTITMPIVILSFMAFLSGIAREIMKGIEDVDGDSLRNVRTVARMKGEAVAGKYSSIIFMVSIALSPIPFLFLEEFFMDFKYLIPVIITDLMLLKISVKMLRGNFGKEDIRKYRKESLIAMTFGLIGFLAGAF